MTDPSLLKGYGALRIKNLKKAHEHFSALQRRTEDPKDRYAALIGLALTNRELGNIERSVELLKKATRTVGEPKEALFNLGNLYEEMGDHALAIQNYDIVISMDPDFHEAYLNRGVAWYNMQKYTEGMNDFKNSITSGKKRSRSLANIGISLLEQEKFESAIDHFDRSLEIDHENIHSLCGKGLALFSMDRYDESIICFDASISINPDFYIAHYYKGHILRGLDLLDEAEEAIKEAIDVREEYPLAWFELGEIHRSKGDRKGAIRAYDKAIRYHQGTYEEALFEKARIHLEMDQMGLAVKSLKRICKINPHVGKVWLEMSKALMKKKGEEDAALKSLNNAYILIPSNVEVINLLSRQLIKKRNIKKAMNVLLAGMESSPDPENGLLLAALQRETGNPSDAIITCEEILSIDPERIDAWLIMGRSYGALDKMEEYKQCLRKYIHKRPDDITIEKEMDSIGT